MQLAPTYMVARSLLAQPVIFGTSKSERAGKRYPRRPDHLPIREEHQGRAESSLRKRFFQRCCGGVLHVVCGMGVDSEGHSDIVHLGRETRFGVRVNGVDAAEKVVELEQGERVPYDALLVATGGQNRRIPVPGIDLEGVYGLRTVADSDRIRAEISPGRKALVVGMGFIGSEIAASLSQLGVEVTVVDRNTVPLRRVLGEKIGRVIGEIHRDSGTELIFEDKVAAFEGAQRVERITTQRGRRIECDFVVVGLGVEPATELLAGTGVEIDNGVLVDEYCRTGVEGIYAAGDVANHYHPVFKRHIRVEHWQNALKQGPAAARNMLGENEPYGEIPWFWSDQYEHNLQYAGFHSEWDELVVRGSTEERNFVAYYRKDGRVLATVAINQGRDLRRSIPLIKAQEEIAAASLRNLDVDLRTLAGATSLR